MVVLTGNLSHGSRPLVNTPPTTPWAPLSAVTGAPIDSGADGGKCYNLALFDCFLIFLPSSFARCVIIMGNADPDDRNRFINTPKCLLLIPPAPDSDQLASYLHCCSTGIGLQVVYNAQRGVTHQQNLNGSFSPVNMRREGPGGQCLCRGAVKTSLE